MSSIRSILEKLAIAATFYGISDKNTKPSVDQALKDISELIDGAKPKLRETNTIAELNGNTQACENATHNLAIHQYNQNLKELLK